MTIDRASLARFGERVAADFLTRRGGLVVGRNVAVARGEVDLIVRWADGHAAVEVKTVGPDSVTTDPVDRITPAKLAQVRRLAGFLAADLGAMRVDFVGVIVGARGVTVTWRANVA